jgi:hypothetical protein
MDVTRNTFMDTEDRQLEKGLLYDMLESLERKIDGARSSPWKSVLLTLTGAYLGGFTAVFAYLKFFADAAIKGG